MFLSCNVVNRFWPTVGNWVSDEYTLSQKDELFLDPRLSALIHHRLDILLLMTKHSWCEQVVTSGITRRDLVTWTVTYRTIALNLTGTSVTPPAPIGDVGQAAFRW